MERTVNVGLVCGLLVATLSGYLQFNIAAGESDCKPGHEARLTTQSNSYDVTSCSASCSGTCYVVEYFWMNPLKYCAPVYDQSRGCKLDPIIMRAASGICRPPLPGDIRCRCIQTSEQWTLQLLNSAKNCVP